jgi:hypothetical protein
MVGVPNLGSPKAYKVLLDGDNFGVPGLSDPEMKKLSQNMPVVYDLAPTYEYFNKAGSFYKLTDLDAVPSTTHDLDYNQATQELRDLDLINSQALSNAENLHTADFDNMDLRNSNIDVYNIVGCKSATFSRVNEFRLQAQPPIFDAPKYTTGDGTVPLISAQNNPTDADKTFFAPKSSHGTLLSANGIRQQIVNIISGSDLSTNGKILGHDAVQGNPKLCQIKGETIKIKSPVAIDVVDESGNHSGLAEDGSIENSIPGADYEIWGEHKYVFLPTDENQQYTINLQGTGQGTFTLEDESIDGDESLGAKTFSNIPVTTQMKARFVFTENGPQILFDKDGDGNVDETLNPGEYQVPQTTSGCCTGYPAPIPTTPGKVLGTFTFKDGTLILDSSDGRTVYLMYHNKKYGFTSDIIFLASGFRFADIISADLISVPLGGLLK